MDAVFQTFENSHIGWNRIEIQPAHLADTPKEADHALIAGRRSIVKRPLSSIDFNGSTVITSIEIYKLTLANTESDSEIVEYDRSAVKRSRDGTHLRVRGCNMDGAAPLDFLPSRK